MRKNLIIRSLALASSTAFLASCAVNPQTGKMGIDPRFSQGFNDIYNNPDPCSNNARNIGIALGGIVGAEIGKQFVNAN